MAFFKTKQYEILGAVVNRVNQALEQIDETTEIELERLLHQAATKTANIIVDELCIEFVKDNRLFNETLFRAQCGNLISKQHAIIEADQEINNEKI